MILIRRNKERCLPPPAADPLSVCKSVQKCLSFFLFFSNLYKQDRYVKYGTQREPFDTAFLFSFGEFLSFSLCSCVCERGRGPLDRLVFLLSRQSPSLLLQSILRVSPPSNLVIHHSIHFSLCSSRLVPSRKLPHSQEEKKRKCGVKEQQRAQTRKGRHHRKE